MSSYDHIGIGTRNQFSIGTFTRSHYYFNLSDLASDRSIRIAGKECQLRGPARTHRVGDASELIRSRRGNSIESRMKSKLVHHSFALVCISSLSFPNLPISSHLFSSIHFQRRNSYHTGIVNFNLPTFIMINSLAIVVGEDINPFRN